MAENKTKPTNVRVEDFLAAIAKDEQRNDCLALVKVLRKLTRHQPKMWGPSIIGFGLYHYVYESGREGDMPVVGFAPRKNEIVLYVEASGKDQQTLLTRLGKHRMGKCCLYIRRLSDVDIKVLEKLVAGSIAEVRRRYGPFPRMKS